MNEIDDNVAVAYSPIIEIWDNSKRAKNLILVFWTLICLTLIGIVSGYYELELLKNLQQGININDSEVNANDLRQGIVGISQSIIYIISVVFFLYWFRRAYGNLHRLGVITLQHNESMSVWCWFIPIIVLFRPVQIMNEIWTKTQESIKKYDTSYPIKGGLLFIGLWWALFLISNFVGRYVFKTAFKNDTIEQLIEGSEAYMISDLIQMPEALLVVVIVLQLSKMETKLSKLVEQAGGKIVYK